MVSAAVTLYPLGCPVLADKLYPILLFHHPRQFYLLPFSSYFSLSYLSSSPFFFFFLQHELPTFCLSVSLPLSLSLSLLFLLSLRDLPAGCSIDARPGNSIKRSARNALSAASKNPRRYTYPDRRICIRASDYIARYRYSSRANYVLFVGKRIDRFKLRLSSRISRDP